MSDKCKHCGGDIAIRNPSGHCDHLYYPDCCDICKTAIKVKPADAVEECLSCRDLLNQIDFLNDLARGRIAHLKDKLAEKERRIEELEEDRAVRGKDYNAICEVGATFQAKLRATEKVVVLARSVTLSHTHDLEGVVDDLEVALAELNKGKA